MANMANADTVIPFIPVQLPVLESRLANLIAGHRIRAGFRLGKTEARICLGLPGPLPCIAEPPCMALEIQGRQWLLAFGQTRYFYDLLEQADPAGFFSDTPPESLPGEIMWAVIEAFMEPELARIEALIGRPAVLVDPAPGPDGLYLGFSIEFSKNGAQSCQVPGTLTLPAEPDSLALLEKLVSGTPKETWPEEQILSLEKEVGIQAGTLRLTLTEFQGLEPGDVLIPDLWLPRENRLALAWGHTTLICTMDTKAGTLVMEGVRPGSPETPGPPPQITRKQKNDHKPEIPKEDHLPMENEETVQEKESRPDPGISSAPQEIMNSDNLELDLSFELGRITLTVAQIRQMAAGQIIALPGQPQEGVSVDIRVNSQVVAKGRIVAVGQDIGIQITRTGNSSPTC